MSESLTGTTTCKTCGSLLPDTYHVVNGEIVCENCRRSAETEWNRGGAAGRFGKALALGLLATAACSLVWYIVLKATDSQFGILAVLVGLAIGGAVRKGSSGRGGWRYQTLAVFLTYTAIVSSYVPFILEELRASDAPITQASHPANQASSTADSSNVSRASPLAMAVGIVVLLGLLYAAPFLAGVQNLLGLLIVGFALYEAWKLNRRAELRASGPHRVSITGARA